jgi:hypothetical protein
MTGSLATFPSRFRALVDGALWAFATTMPECPMGDMSALVEVAG